MTQENLNEREFELINIIGKRLGSNQRDLSQHLNLSLGQTNMLIRRMVAKGYIRITQLNQKKMMYILTPKGIAEKLRKSVKYTMNTLNAIGLIKARTKNILLKLYREGQRCFYLYSEHDLATLVEIVFAELKLDGAVLTPLKEFPDEELNGILLIGKESLPPDRKNLQNRVDLIMDLSRQEAEFSAPAQDSFLNIPVFIQARMSSQRLPGKMLIEVQDKPLLSYVVDRLRFSQRAKQIVVITSCDSSDDPLAQWCLKNGVDVFRGDLQDVYGRFAAAARHYGADAFVRISGDSPLIDPEIVDEAIGIFEQGEGDLVTNVFPRSFPKGESVEVIRSKTFLEYDPRITASDEREHVTLFFYRNPQSVRIKNISNSAGDYAAHNLCVDTPDDLARFQKIVGLMDKPLTEYGWQNCLALSEEEVWQTKR
ncbi:MAG: NTP transferase domain-containing protein [Candidatus Omnitrophota bacterium]